MQPDEDRAVEATPETTHETPQETAQVETPAAEPTRPRGGSRAMTTVIGRWDGDDMDVTFKVLAHVGKSATEKQISDALRQLGPGIYDVLTFRSVRRELEQKTVDIIRAV